MDFKPFTFLKPHSTDDLNWLLDNNKIAGDANRQAVIATCDWRTEYRPYYNVYPVILDSILKTDLSSLKISDIKLPSDLNTLVFKFDTSSGRQPVLIARAKDGVIIVNQTHELECSTLVMLNKREITNASEKWHEIFKIIIGCLFLDDEFVERDMNDKEKRNNKPLQYFQKIGKVGWNIGANVEKEKREMGAHFRSPHLAVRWCGIGRKERRIVRVKGSIVNKKKLTEIPTGYEDLNPIVIQ